jgi:hypothetical protein
MGLLRDAACVAVGYGAKSLKDKHDSKIERINEVKNTTLRKHLAEFRNAHHIVPDTNDSDAFIRELKEIVHDYELGIWS